MSFSFFRDVIASIIKQSEEATSSHSSFKICDPTAVGSSPVRELSLDVVPVSETSSIITLAWKDSAEKVLEKTTSPEEASHVAQLISTDLAQLVKLTDENKYDEAKEVMKNMLKEYSQDSNTPVATNMPVLNNTQAELDIDANLWKQAGQVKLQNIFPSGTVQNLVFENQEDLAAYQGKGKGAGKEVPLWEQEGKGKAPESKDELSAPSLSYEDVENQKEEEHESMKDHIDETIKKELESALQEKAASVFGPEQVELVKVLRLNGRNWDEITKMLTKDFHYDKDATTIFVDQQRQAAGDEGIEIKKEEPSPLKPPENLVSPETHDKLLEDLKKDKEPEIEKVDEPIVEESALNEKCPSCGHMKPIKGECPGCKRCDCEQGHVESAIEEISRADNSDIRKVAADTHEHTCSKCDKVWECHKGEACHEGKNALCGKHYAEEEYGKKESSLKVASVLSETVKQDVMEVTNSMYRMNAPGAKWYRFSVSGDKIYRGEYSWEDEFGPYQFIYNMETGEYKENPNYKPTAFASLKRAAAYMNISETDPIEKTAADDVNPLQEPISETPTMETPSQDVIPFGKDTSHRSPKPESWVIVQSDLKSELPAFRAKFVSEETESDGTKWGIVDKDGELLKVEMHRITPETEGAQTADPIAEPQIEKPQESDIPVTPSMDSLHSASSLKEADEASDEIRFERAVNILDKKMMRGEIHQEEYDAAYEALKKQMFPNEIDPNKHLYAAKCSDTSGTEHAGPVVKHQHGTDSTMYCDKHLPSHIKYNTPEPKTAAKVTKCVKCDKELPVEKMVSNEHGAGYLCKEHAAEWNKDASLKKVAEKCEVCSRPMNDKNPDSKKGVCQDCKEDKDASQDDLLSIKAEAEQLLKDVNGMGKTSYQFVKKGLEKHANDSAFEGNGWVRVWVQEDEVASNSKYPEILKMPDEAARIEALKELAREIAHEALSLADSSAAKVGVQNYIESLSPSDHDRIDWVALASPQQEEVESSLKTDANRENSAEKCKCGHIRFDHYLPNNVQDTEPAKCDGGEGCSCKYFKKAELKQASGVEDVMRGQAGPRQIGKVWVKDNYDGEVMVYSTHFADKAEFDRWVASKIEGSTTKEIVKSEFPVTKKASDFEKGISQNKTAVVGQCNNCGKQLGEGEEEFCAPCREELRDDLPVNKTADEPAVEPKTFYKELKKAPAGVDREKAVPATPELDAVLAKMDALEQNLATLDTTVKQIMAKAKEEVAKVEQAAERVQMEKEFQDSINKSGVLIDALENKVVAWRDKIYTMQTQEVSYVPNITPKEMLSKIFANFEKAEAFVTSVLNGMKSQAVKVLEKTLVQFPGKKSSLNKEASIIDQWNEELLQALKELSSPL
jgi:hypothetical protein